MIVVLHYIHNKDGRTAPGVCGNCSVPLRRGTLLRELEYTHTHTVSPAARRGKTLVLGYFSSIVSVHGINVKVFHSSPFCDSAQTWENQVVCCVVVVMLLFYVHGKHLRSCRDSQLT